MKGDRVALFRRAKVVKKSSKEAAVLDVPRIHSTTTEAPAALLGKGMLPLKRALPYSQKGTTSIPPHQTRILMKIQERIGKDYKFIRDPLEVHSALALHLIKAMNAACRVDFLDDARQETCQKERALQLQVKELKEENDRLKVAATQAVKEKKEATSQAIAEIKKHDALQARFTRLESEHFDLT
ncbi:hypothetical protein LIER_08173 [Lithospermum erythrorhizon]|uniref:Uncharacterized protein n=1 Tax=Lithospermum erythrorhizon TaxID=34254 RepID=A0AAV3PB06_LITER